MNRPGRRAARVGCHMAFGERMAFGNGPATEPSPKAVSPAHAAPSRPRSHPRGVPGSGHQRAHPRPGRSLRGADHGAGRTSPARCGSGRRRKLAAPAGGRASRCRPAPSAGPGRGQPPRRREPGAAGQQPHRDARRPSSDSPDRTAGRSYAIGAPDESAAEGPEPLDGPGGAVEVADRPQPQPLDDELPPEPLDNPRRLLVWPAPDVATQQALTDRGYRPVIVHSREEVDAQIAAFPAALFVDPLTGPITRTALQSLRQAAVAAEVPVLVTAGLGQATREAAYGADPAVLLKALAPRDSEQHPPRVLLDRGARARSRSALTATLERRGMQVAHGGDRRGRGAHWPRRCGRTWW